MQKSLKILLVSLVLSLPIIARGQGFRGTCIGMWAKISSYLGWDGPGGKIKTIPEILQYIEKQAGITAEELPIKITRPLEDISFKEVKYGDKTYQYSKMPQRIKTVREGDMLFYGKAVASLADALGQVKSLFSKGGMRDPKGAHNNIKTHIISTKYERSVFMQTTKSYEIAEFFAQGNKAESTKNFGVVFVINPTKMEVLDVDRFLAYAWKASKFVQKEVLLNQNLPPRRVVLAIVIERTSEGWVPFKLIRNSSAIQ